MIVKQYIKNFEKLGMGMFVHFGLYSIYGKGEWIYSTYKTEEERADYRALAKCFNPEPDWAKRLVATAKAGGCKYITLTTRHHDGFSLYDTCGLSDYDAVQGAAGRDLVREFVDECRNQDIIPFFYHTLLDWYVPEYQSDFKAYLAYLRRSVELLCTNYGKIGGIWFDGKWNKPDEDWEEDALYGMIRSHQPEAMIINNTGLSALGALGHIELDSVTFERGTPKPINLEGSPKYIASEMCQIFGDFWGYAYRDFHFKSLSTIIEDLCSCRKYGSNFLLNVGPKESGYLRTLDEAMFGTLGEWVALFDEALRDVRPAGVTVSGREKDFLLKGKDCYYLFCYDLPVNGSVDVVKLQSDPDYTDRFTTDERIKAVYWLDDKRELAFHQDGNEVAVHTLPYRYGENTVVHVAKIEFE